MSKRNAYVHFGLHKTGTTALQNSFWKNRDALGLHGIYLPKIGRRYPHKRYLEHHNVAMEISSDRNFLQSNGGLSAIIEECRNVDEDILLSSEYFTHSLVSEERLAVLHSAFSNAGFDLVAIIYLRNQCSYFESIFPQFLLVEVQMTLQWFFKMLSTWVDSDTVNGWCHFTTQPLLKL